MTPRTSHQPRPFLVGVIGDHPWARALLQAVVQRGGLLAVCAGPEELRAWAVRLSPSVTLCRDADSVLSHQELNVVVLADVLPFRGELLLEAVQLDRAVLVLHPADLQVERYHIVQLALEERHFPVWPLMPHRFFSGLVQLRQLLQQVGESRAWQLEANVAVPTDAHQVGAALPSNHVAFPQQVHPLWFWADWLRLLGGEVAEVYAISEASRLDSPSTPLTITGRWERGGQFVVRFAPNVAEGFQLQRPQGLLSWQGNTVAPGDHRWRWHNSHGDASHAASSESVWQAYADWLLQIGGFCAVPPQWSDAVAAAEIVQAVEDSLRARRAITLLHPEYTESAVFKSRAATFGCGLVWLMLVLALISPLVPQVLYAIPVLLVLCLVLFVIGWLAFRR